MPHSRSTLLTEAELTLLHQLSKHRVQYMIVGMAGAVFHGADVVTQDIDIWFKSYGDENVQKAIEAAGGIIAWRLDPPRILGKDLDHFDIVFHCDGLRSFDAEYKRVSRIPFGDFRIKVLPLERILASKIAANREKDRKVIPALKAAIAARKK